MRLERIVVTLTLPPLSAFCPLPNPKSLPAHEEAQGEYREYSPPKCQEASWLPSPAYPLMCLTPVKILWFPGVSPTLQQTRTHISHLAAKAWEAQDIPVVCTLPTGHIYKAYLTEPRACLGSPTLSLICLNFLFLKV